MVAHSLRGLRELLQASRFVSIVDLGSFDETRLPVTWVDLLARLDSARLGGCI